MCLLPSSSCRLDFFPEWHLQISPHYLQLEVWNMELLQVFSDNPILTVSFSVQVHGRRGPSRTVQGARNCSGQVSSFFNHSCTQCCGFGSGWVLVVRIRRAKNYLQYKICKLKKICWFEVLDVLFEAGGFSCSLDVLHGQQGINI